MIFTNRILDASERASTILVVEDEAPSRTLICHILTQAGYKTIAATDGIEGLKKFTDHDDIALIVADLAMPGMNGLDLIRNARLRRPEVKSLFVSGAYDQFPELDRSLHCLTKPFTVQELLKAVSDAMEQPASAIELGSTASPS